MQPLSPIFSRKQIQLPFLLSTLPMHLPLIEYSNKTLSPQVDDEVVIAVVNAIGHRLAVMVALSVTAAIRTIAVTVATNIVM